MVWGFIVSEQEQAEDSKKPKAKKAVKNPGSRPRRARKTQQVVKEEEEEEIELETSRSGRVRKKPKFRWVQAVISKSF